MYVELVMVKELLYSSMDLDSVQIVSVQEYQNEKKGSWRRERKMNKCRCLELYMKWLMEREEPEEGGQ